MNSLTPSGTPSARRAVTAESTGAPDVLSLVDSPLPELAGGSLRVRVHYAGVNFWDVMQRRGTVPLPEDCVPGVEGVGTVVESTADPALVGTRVAWGRVASSYATEVQGPVDSFVVVPDELSDQTAGGLLMQGVTAQYLSTDTTSLRAGQTAVVMAAAGGVGSLLTQLLRARGVSVVGVVGDPAKSEAAATAGAELVVVDSPSLIDSVRAAHADGVDAVFDANGGDVNRLFGLLRRRGICVLYGAANGAIAPIDPGALAGGSFYVTRTAGRDYAAEPGEWNARAADVLTRAVAGELAVHVSSIHPLASAAEAHRLIESRLTTGKLLLDAR